MNELEVTVWSMWLNKLGWDMQDISLDNFLLITAIQVKEYLNDKPKYNQNRIKEECPNIDLLYDKWKTTHNLDINLKEINKLYRKYRQVNLLVSDNSLQLKV
jgi:hypothetical protein